MERRKLNNSDPVLSLVVPVFNEEANVADIIQRTNEVMKSLDLTYEIILVNDGSLDNTLKNAAKYSKTNGFTRIVSYGQNIGKGFALRTGFSNSRGKYVVFIDGDMEVNPSQIGRYVKALDAGDLVIASKRHPNSRVSAPLLRRFLSLGFNWLVRFCTGLRLSDTQSGLKAVRRQPLQDVFSVLLVKRFAFDVELLVVANLQGLRIVELPIEIELTRSTFKVKEILRMLLDLLSISYRLRVLRYYQHLL